MIVAMTTGRLHCFGTMVNNFCASVVDKVKMKKIQRRATTIECQVQKAVV